LLVYGQDRAVAMTEARRQFSIMGPLGWTFAKCLAYSWTKIKRQAALHSLKEICGVYGIRYIILTI